MKPTKQQVLNVLNHHFSASEVEQFNKDMLVKRYGWYGGDYTELDIKNEILDKNRKLFTKEEYYSLKEKYNPNQRRLVK